MDNLNTPFGTHWGQRSESNDDFINMLPDVEYLTEHNPALSPAANPSNTDPRGPDSLGRPFQHGSHPIQGSFQQQAPYTTAQNPPSIVSGPLPTAMPQTGDRPRQNASKGASRNTNAQLVNALSSWGLPMDGQEFNFGLSQNMDNDDGQSTCSSCLDSCPSHCGETGQGSICCDADNCEAQNPQDLCIDEACEGANHPCTDENCFGDSVPPSGTREEAAAAAAALASFGDLGDINSFANGNQFGSFGNDFSMGPNQQLPLQATQGMDFANMNATSDTQFNPFPMGPDVCAHGHSQYQLWQQAPTMEFFNHLLEYHHPSHGHAQHMRPCLADNPNFMGTKCPLPNPNFDQVDLDGFLCEAPNFQCGFSAQDPAVFADHVVKQHKSLLSNLPPFNTTNSPTTSWNQLQQAKRGDDQNYSNTNQTNQNRSVPTFRGVNPHMHCGRLSQMSTSASSGTVASVRTTPLPTPDSPLTPHSFEASLHEPGFQHQEATPESGRQGQSLGLENAYQCFWRDHETGEPCLRNFEDSDQLDAHCRNEHTKTLEKAEGGFRCMWQSCKREGDCFHTKAKLNRHLQTHTGFKPMQCHVCGMRLSAKQALEQHIRTHTNDKPYVCQYGCGRSFKQHSALTMHHRTHTKEKPLKCDVCGAVFTESSNLSKHRRTHMVKGMFQCELCDKDFHRLDQLRRHLVSSHKDRPEDANRAIERAKSMKRKIHHVSRAKARSTSTSSAATTTPTELGLPSGEDFFLDDISMEGIKTEENGAA